MRTFNFGKVQITEDSPPFVIAEIGSNHEGSIDKCLEMIALAAKCGCDAVKLQKRNPKQLFCKRVYNAPYDNEMSFGKTYGEHREFLDGFHDSEYRQIDAAAKVWNIPWFATPFDEDAIDFLLSYGVPVLKFASCHVLDIPLLQHAAKFNVPMILSTGGHGVSDVLFTYSRLNHAVAADRLAILHCVSTYPNQDHQLNLKAIETIKINFPDNIVGFSSHHPAVFPNLLAYTLGARIFEVHITLNRAGKGTDNRFAFERKGLETLVEDLRRCPDVLGCGEKKVNDYERGGFVDKMGRSVHPLTTIVEGEMLTRRNVGLRAPADGPPAYLLNDYIGKIAVTTLTTADTLTKDKVK